MITISPFKAVRPPRDKAHLVASRSYVSYTPAGLKRKLSENPYSFIHIINPEFETGEPVRKNSPDRFEKVRRKYGWFLEKNILKRDTQKAIYLYEQSTPEANFIGFIAGVHANDYRNGLIKKHEQTLTKRETMFCSYLDVCGFNAEPVLLTYRERISSLDALKARIKLERPEYEFTTTDRTTHRLWIISDNEDLDRISQAFKKVNSLYIADGHHRMASSALLAEKKASQNKTHTGIEDYNHTMALIMHGETLKISPFHRLLGKQFEMAEEELIERLREKFNVEKSDHPILPNTKRQFGLRARSGWYNLRLKHYEGNRTAVSHLDTVILTDTVLAPIFGIVDQKTDKRIEFIPGSQDLKATEDQIDKGNAKALFTLYQVTAEELYAISDEGSTMPPKTTFVEPKLRSGLTIMNLE